MATTLDGLPVVLIACPGQPQLTSSSALADHRYSVSQAHTGQQAIDLARERPPDTIILDADLPDMSGIEACRLLRGDLHVAPGVPILIVCADEPSTEQRVTALRAGAWGFVPTPRDAAALALQLQAYVQAKQSVDHAFAEGLIDRATGVHTRVGLVRRAREIGALMTRTHGSLACIVFALDTEPAGAAAASVVTRNTRASDAVGIFDPTAVAVLAPATDHTGAALLAERVGAALGDAALRVGYDAVANLTYAPMDTLDLLARARLAVRQGRPDPARTWLRRFEGSSSPESGGTPRPSPSGLVLEEGKGTL